MPRFDSSLPGRSRAKQSRSAADDGMASPPATPKTPAVSSAGASGDSELVRDVKKIIAMLEELPDQLIERLREEMTG